MVEVKNAIEQSNKEISTRFDFKGSDTRIEYKENELTAFADDDFKLSQVKEVLLGIAGELAKKIVKLIKDSKIKVQASIQGDAIRVNGAKRDDLQNTIGLLKKSD
ncbi:hypothetical protein ACTFIZ_007961 [Dictyostelium cf. discoideum]